MSLQHKVIQQSLKEEYFEDITSLVDLEEIQDDILVRKGLLNVMTLEGSNILKGNVLSLPSDRDGTESSTELLLVDCNTMKLVKYTPLDVEQDDISSVETVRLPFAVYNQFYKSKTGSYPSYIHISTNANYILYSLYLAVQENNIADINLTETPEGVHVMYTYPGGDTEITHAFDEVLTPEMYQQIFRILTFDKGDISISEVTTVDTDYTVTEGVYFRVCISSTNKQYSTMTLRVIDSTRIRSFDSLLIEEEDKAKIQKLFIEDTTPGLRLVVGPTGSGKNTTINSILQELLKYQRKIMTVEYPIEDRHNSPYIIQQEAHDDTSYRSLLLGLLRHNPSLVYITEIRDAIGPDVGTILNTGKYVISTLHANSAPLALDRLSQVTGLSTQSLKPLIKCIVCQSLVKDIETGDIHVKTTVVEGSEL